MLTGEMEAQGCLNHESGSLWRRRKIGSLDVDFFVQGNYWNASRG